MSGLNDQQARDLVQMLRRCRFDLSSEKRLQAEMEEALRVHGVRFEREKRLSAMDIPDFLVEGGIVVECKMRAKAKKMAVYLQMRRYASYPEVACMVLATNMSMGLPEQIEGKDVYIASLSSGWM